MLLHKIWVQIRDISTLVLLFYTVINEFWSYTSVCIVSACTCMILRFLYMMIIVCTTLLNEVTLAV